MPLHLNWIRTVRNIATYHDAPVRSIAGVPGTNFLYSGDESGVIYCSQFDHGTLTQKSSVNLKAEIRSLTVSPDGQSLLVVLLDHAAIYKINDDKTLTEAKKVNFQGKGKHGTFLANDHFIVLSTEGLTRFEVKNTLLSTGDLVKMNNCLAFAVGKSGEYFCSGRR